MIYYIQQICLGGFTMAIAKRIKHVRGLQGLTQKELGKAIGFKGKSSDVRIAQYESETRIPKDDLLANIAEILQVSQDTLAVPNIDTLYRLNAYTLCFRRHVWAKNQ